MYGKHRQAGFTLVELMIVLAIVGMLAAIAIPAYQEYLVRSRITEGLSVGASAKALVTENAANGLALDQGWTSIKTDENVNSIQVNSGNGEITVQYQPVAKDVVLKLIPRASTGEALEAGRVPTGQVVWVCITEKSAQNRYVPSSCRD